MKKAINISLVLFVTLILSSCLTSQDDINEAKQNLWIINEEKNIDNNLSENWNENLEEDKIIQDEIIKEEVVEKEEEIKQIIVKSLTDIQFLEFDDLSNENIFDKEVEIKWKTLEKVDKIIVTFTNKDSNFPDDVYQLKQFTPWDSTFLYRAFTKYETLDKWENIYVFEAFSWDVSTKLEITINVIKKVEKIKEDNNMIDSRVEDIGEESYESIDLDKLPVNSKFWTPVDLWWWKISYTDLKWLEIKKDVNSSLTCENLTSTLADNLNTWFFWNTCRPIETDEWISFYVIKLDGDNYIYEKHYYLSYQGIYWIQEIETGTWVNSENIWEKNNELKMKNEDYEILKITDELFKEILK